VLIAGPLSAAQISGSAATPGNVNLTSEGTADWIHWGQTNSTTVNRKSGGGSQFSNLTLINNVTNSAKARLTDSASKLSWTDGTPTPSVTNIPNGVYINNFDGPGRGFEFTAPADLLERILKVYLGEYNATGTIQAFLSDASAPMYTDTLTGVADSTVQGVYTLHYTAASAGQNLTVRWKESAKLGAADNVTIQAATLQVAFIPEPATLGLLSSGLALLAMRRRTKR